MKMFLFLMSLYVLGSARGASVRPDELPGSMEPEAPVRQFSGESFSLANPSDGKALEETSRKSSLREHASGEHGLVSRASGEHLSNEHASDEPSSGEQAAVSEHAAGEQPSSEQLSGEQPSGEQLSSEQLSGEQPPGEQLSGEQPSSEQLSGEQASGEQASGEQASGEQASGEQASGEQASGEQASGEQASGEHASGEQDSGEKQLDEPSATASSTFAGPEIDCHTCTYMNDQKQCLRGEGVCTTKHSQQCMLKKVFEGWKTSIHGSGCENMCPSMTLFSHGTRMQIICCRTHPFCNRI